MEHSQQICERERICLSWNPLVKQQAASDEGELLSCFRAFFYEDVCDEKLLFKKIVPVCSLSDGNKDDKCIFIVSLLYINFTSKKK